jgi:HSP20 family molecular chaperone IbpA
MPPRDWDVLLWRQANDLLQQVERIHRNFIQVAVGAQYRSFGRGQFWEPPANIIETDQSVWIICAIPGVTADQVDVRLEARELVVSGERAVPTCCKDGDLKAWEIPLGRFERRFSAIEGAARLALNEVKLENGLLLIELRKYDEP